MATPTLAGKDLSTSRFCVTTVNSNLTIYQGFGAEVLATGILVFMVCATMDSRNVLNTDSTSIKFGLAVFCLCLAFMPYTGCGMNPARSLGPALLNNNWKHHWIFWCGPITGALLASILYQAVFMQSLADGI